MGKHFVTVCVFCLLCATHTPCSSHVQLSTNELKSGLTSEPLNLPIKNNEVFQKITDRYSPTTTTTETTIATIKDDDVKLRANEINLETNSLSSNLTKHNKLKLKKRNKRDIRNKNHHNHHHTNILNHINNNNNLNNNINETEYIEKIFTLFGNGETINQDGFERLIKTLHLDELLWSKINNTSVNLSPVKVNANGIQNDTNITCMDHRNLIKSTTSIQQKDNTTIDIDYNSFNRLCPILMYQMVAPSSAERRGCIKVVTNSFNSNVNFDPMNRADHLSESVYSNGLSNTASVWLYATLSIIIISACGLLGVLVIPIMQQHFYHHLIQFLVALAVGTLAGDALLHLLPHAMMPHTHHDHHNETELEEMEDQHERNMWRGFVAMIGLIFFFFMEKCLTLCAEWRKQRQLKKNKLPIKVRVMRETDAASSTSVGCKHKYSSYPYCYGVIATETQDDHHNHPHAQDNDAMHNTQSTILNDGDSESEVFAKNQNQNHNTHSHQETNSNLSKCTVNTKSMKCSESNKMLADNADTHTLQDFVTPKNEISESESYTVILRTHENKHHGHSHTHGHVHSAPKSMSSVAWMVVMGDGLHNFTDGMAIGAAFAGSLAGGFSTAVAVFCHELPHEIGDFAVLLKAGMTARQAIFYNMLSSLLCLFGMILGVFLGNNDSASSWIFACAAGMFLYIALVDMIPELTTSHSKEGGSFLQCILQFFGLIMGLGLMLVIALYEHDLKLLFHD